MKALCVVGKSHFEKALRQISLIMWFLATEPGYIFPHFHPSSLNILGVGTCVWINKIDGVVDREVRVIFFTQAVITSPAITEDRGSRPNFFSNDRKQSVRRSIFHGNKKKIFGPPFNSSKYPLAF